MAFVREKKIKGHSYFYLVRSERDGKSVRQKVIKYLGKNGYAGCAPAGFTSAPTKDPFKKYSKAFNDLGVDVECSLPTGEDVEGSYGPDHERPGRLVAKFKLNPAGETMAHELGHAIEHYISDTDDDDRPSRSEDPEFRKFSDEIHKINEYCFGDKAEGGLSARSDVLKRYKKSHPELSDVVDKELQETREYEEYARSPVEGFANLFATCVTDPKRAKRLAPKASDWLMKELYQEPEVRNLMTEMDWWNLERLPDQDTQPE